jgi:hypothetical protein
MYIAQAQVVIASYEHDVALVVIFGIILGLTALVNYRYVEDTDVKGWVYTIVGFLGLFWLFIGVFGTICGGYSEYAQAKLNPEYWAYKKLLGVLSKF